METPGPPQRLLELYAALLACDHAIIRCTGKVAMFEAVCESLVAKGGLQLAWIGMLDSGDPRLWPQAHSGEAWNASDWMGWISKASTLADQGLAGAAVAQGRAGQTLQKAHRRKLFFSHGPWRGNGVLQRRFLYFWPTKSVAFCRSLIGMRMLLTAASGNCYCNWRPTSVPHCSHWSWPRNVNKATMR